ncbi:MOSC domain-containing protein [soil metagenome]
MYLIRQLYIYPIKSLGGIAVNSAVVTSRGFEHDRRWLLVDENNCFLTQRVLPEMALLKVEIEDDGLRVTHKIKGDALKILFTAHIGKAKAAVTIWDDTCTAQFVSNEADEWFSTKLGMNCRLVYMPDDTERIVDQNYAREKDITSFSDAYPFLIIGQASLDELNGRLDEALPVNRFRPNIVFTGGKPFDEDLMRRFTIGDITFHGVKLCARCNIPTIDQEKGTKSKEPTKTLATYRKKNNKILLGQNLVHDGSGEIAVGDMLDILQWNTDERFIVGLM